ncbi:hypothetical protein GCM10007276_32300 [Agaricicola taiwanensis]|uniref:DUF1178 family protein n=1 Tax=Agaricicola taiwanensis TaxID=591372 RepID=A0A8J3E125_9RHOB|nr:DUF1178 family protein [Agaricicola taiwanensis]GGE52827.1 hypothetical protein GCM10007276_32300 [Agaricicola taiwanensis]
MIRYSLACDAGHEFEGWFQSSSAFDEQLERGLLSCAVCGSSQVGKALMSPALGGARQNKAPDAPELAPVAEAPVPVALLGEREKALRAAIKALRDDVAKNSENVGERFAEEARKIHYGERDPASIYGQATLDEAASLAEEGVSFLPLPSLPDDGH